MKKKYIDVNIEIDFVNSDVFLSFSNGDPFGDGDIDIGDVFFDEGF